MLKTSQRDQLRRIEQIYSAKDMSMKLVATVAATAVLALVSTVAMAQTTTATTPAASTTTNKTSTDKATVSKSCSTQADAKGLHGKERKKFRSQCKKNGGKA